MPGEVRWEDDLIGQILVFSQAVYLDDHTLGKLLGLIEEERHKEHGIQVGVKTVS